MNKQPLLFIGHGSPMNAIQSNIYTESWKNLWLSLSEPRAIVIFSAHWITEWETRISSAKSPEMIYDMYGFPLELYRFQYKISGSPEIAENIYTSLIRAFPEKYISLDGSRWIDHGIWSTLAHIFPEGHVPVISVSLDYQASSDYLFSLGKALSYLRDEGVLFIASGNIVHNLRAIDWSWTHIYDWAKEFDQKVANSIENRDYNQLLDFKNWWDISQLAHPSYDHLLPLFPLLGMVDETDSVDFLTPDIVMGSLSMRSVRWSSL